MSEDIDRILERDPIGEISDKTGKHHSDFNSFESLYALINGYKVNEEKKKKLKEMNDTYMSMSWDEFINIIEGFGFEEEYKEDYKYTCFEPVTVERFVIYVDYDRKLLIHANSFDNITSVNGGYVHGYIYVPERNEINKEKRRKIRSKLKKCNYSWDEGKCKFSKDIREGLIYRLNEIESVTDFVDGWDGDEFLQLMTLEDRNKEDDDLNIDDSINYTKRKSQEKVEECSKKFQKMIRRV